MGNYEKSHEVHQAISERYHTSSFSWYFWCKRTGYGNVQEAQKIADSFFESQELPWYSNLTERAGIFYILSGQDEKAFDVFDRMFNFRKNPYRGFHLALLADALGRFDKRDEVLQAVIEEGPSAPDYTDDTQSLAKAAGLLLSALRKGEELDLAAIDAVIEGAPSGISTNLVYFIGRFLELRGSPEQAWDYFDRAAMSKDTLKYNHILACDAVRRLGYQPGCYPRTRSSAPSTD